MSFVDRNAVDPKRLLRNSQRFRNGDATGSIKVTAPIALNAGAISLSLLSTGGLNLNSGQLQVKLADSTLATGAAGLKVGSVLAANLPADVAYVDVSNVFTVGQTFQGTITAVNGLLIEAGVAATGAWIDMPTTGPSGIGSGGVGANAWIAYVKSGGQWFPNAVAGDIAVRCGAANSLLLGADPTFAAIRIQPFLSGHWLDMPTTGPSGIGSGGAGSNAWLAYCATNGNWFTGSLVGDIVIRNSTRILVGIGTGLPTFIVTGSTLSLTHLAGKNTAPGIAAGAGAGTGPTVSLSGTDLAGQVTVTTGTLPAASAVIVTVTFNTAFAAAPFVVFSPANAAAASLSGLASIYVTATTATFVFNADSTALTASTQYLWNYHTIG